MNEEQLKELEKYLDADFDFNSKPIRLMKELYQYKEHIVNHVYKNIEQELLNKLEWYQNNTKIHSRKIAYYKEETILICLSSGFTDDDKTTGEMLNER